jgi:hypothetical protein
MRDRLAGIDLAKNWTNVAVSLKEKKKNRRGRHGVTRARRIGVLLSGLLCMPALTINKMPSYMIRDVQYMAGWEKIPICVCIYLYAYGFSCGIQYRRTDRLAVAGGRPNAPSNWQA